MISQRVLNEELDLSNASKRVKEVPPQNENSNSMEDIFGRPNKESNPLNHHPSPMERLLSQQAPVLKLPIGSPGSVDTQGTIRSPAGPPRSGYVSCWLCTTLTSCWDQAPKSHLQRGKVAHTAAPAFASDPSHRAASPSPRPGAQCRQSHGRSTPCAPCIPMMESPSADSVRGAGHHLRVALRGTNLHKASSTAGQRPAPRDLHQSGRQRQPVQGPTTSETLSTERLLRYAVALRL